MGIKTPSINLQQIKAYILREKAICLLPLIAIWCGLTLSSYWRPTWDSAMYITMGKSIITGHGSRYMGYGGVKYPPGFPFMLGLIIGPFGYNFLLMRMLIVASAVGSIWLAYLVIRDRSNRWIATGVMCSTAFSFPVIFECTRILSDLPYAFISLLALYWIERYAKDTDQWRGKIGYITIGLIVAAYLTRIVGLTLFVGAIAYLIFDGVKLSNLLPFPRRLRDGRVRKNDLKPPLTPPLKGGEPALSADLPSLRRRGRGRLSGPSRRRGAWGEVRNLKKAIAIGVVLITVPPIWMAQNHLRGPKLPAELREALSYEKELLIVTTTDPDAPFIRWKDFIERIKDNEKYYESLLSNIMSGKRIDSATRARVMTLILLAGYLYCLIRHRSVLEYYTFFYMLTYILWTSKQGERFLVPIIPILFYYLFRLLTLMVSGIRWLVRRTFQWEDGRKIFETAGVIILTGVLIQSNWATDIDIIQREHHRPYYSERNVTMIDLARWLKDNTPPDTLVVSDSPSYMHLFSDRKTFSFAWIKDPTEVFKSINRIGTDYVISMPGGRSDAYLKPMLKTYANYFDTVHRQGEYVIYRVKNGAIENETE